MLAHVILRRSNVPVKRSASVLKEALLSGINFFDTADIYGRGRLEKLIGQITQNADQKISICTKVGNKIYDDKITQDSSQGWLRSCFKESCQRLNVNLIDTLLSTLSSTRF